eukprot:TRINITY_DN60618_c0_g1_i1.p2 TRINITY_DN60618_c0_g1~~TRINITY_DN60618_c0_g1_i1.p2  ORF type:complete len:120 (-),score=30.63 TRINITY_DN60618_c0_g1_i1:99-458(-)
MIRRPPRSTLSSSSAASDVYKRQAMEKSVNTEILEEVGNPGRGDVSRLRDLVNTAGADPNFCSEASGGWDPLMLACFHGHLDLSLIHISEPTRLLSISYAVFCLKKKKKYVSCTEKSDV